VDKHVFMRACREGGDSIEQALRALDRSMHAVLYRECVRVLRDPEGARDLVQETFIKVWQRCATFRGDSELLPWVKSILRHGILDRVRRPHRDVPMPEESEGAPALAHGPLRLPDDPVERQQLDACFERCWKRFEEASPSHAAVMAWIVEDGLTNEQISELLGRTPGATREFVSQCRKRARVHLAEWYAMAFGTGGSA
jgi:RNA polymerase sigma-70 factor (ECF subfamily)